MIRSSWVLIAAFLISTASAFAADNTSTATVVAPPAPDVHPFSQTFSVEAGSFRPAGLSLGNSNFRYSYNGDSLNSFLVEPGWGMKLFHLLGAVYIEENLALTGFKGKLPPDLAAKNNGNDALSLFMFGLDTRVRHSWEWFPVHVLIPFVEAGYQYTFYSQSGPSDFESAQGGVGNFVMAGGLDLWVNGFFPGADERASRYYSTPVFLTAKYNHIAAHAGGVDLGSDTFLAGLSIGI